MQLSEKEQQQINTLVGRFEADTGVEALAAVVEKADAYPEIPWKAYAMGSAIGACAALLFPWLLIDWSVISTIAFCMMAVLGAGALLCAAAAFIPPVGRLFLHRIRAQGEVRQHALSLCVERGIFETSHRCAVLMLVARYERRVAIIPDSGLAKHTSAAAIDGIAEAMSAALRTGGPVSAFETGFRDLRALIQAHGYTPAVRASEIEDAVITGKGA